MNNNSQNKRVQHSSPKQTSKVKSSAKSSLRLSHRQKLGCVGFLLLVVLTLVLIVVSCSSGLSIFGDLGKSPNTQENTTVQANMAVASRFDIDSSTADMPENVESPYAVLISRSTNKVIAQRGANEKVYPASLTKMMTLIVAYENGNLDDTYTFTNSDLKPLFRENASVAGFKEGEQVSLRDMIYGLILPSGADGAVGIANLVGGSEGDFVAMMNSKATEMGLTHTHFANPTGLHDENQYSTPLELSVILDYAMQDDFCREVLSTYKYTTSPTNKNENGIELVSTLQSKMEGSESGVAHILGGKTGYTIEAKNCLASFGVVDATGDEYIIVTCGVSGEFKPMFDAINIYRAFFGDGSTYTGPGT